MEIDGIKYEVIKKHKIDLGYTFYEQIVYVLKKDNKLYFYAEEINPERNEILTTKLEKI